MIKKAGLLMVILILVGCSACKEVETNINLKPLERIMSIRYTGMSDEVIQTIQDSCTDEVAQTIIKDVQESNDIKQWIGNPNYKLAVQSYELYDDMTLRVTLESSQKENVLNNSQVIEVEVNKDGKIEAINTNDITSNLMYD